MQHLSPIPAASVLPQVPRGMMDSLMKTVSVLTAFIYVSLELRVGVQGYTCKFGKHQTMETLSAVFFNLSGTRDHFCGRQFFHRHGRGVVCR